MSKKAQVEDFVGVMIALIGLVVLVLIVSSISVKEKSVLILGVKEIGRDRYFYDVLNFLRSEVDGRSVADLIVLGEKRSLRKKADEVFNKVLGGGYCWVISVRYVNVDRDDYYVDSGECGGDVFSGVDFRIPYNESAYVNFEFIIKKRQAELKAL